MGLALASGRRKSPPSFGASPLSPEATSILHQSYNFQSFSTFPCLLFRQQHNGNTPLFSGNNVILHWSSGYGQFPLHRNDHPAGSAADSVAGCSDDTEHAGDVVLQSWRHFLREQDQHPGDCGRGRIVRCDGGRAGDRLHARARFRQLRVTQARRPGDGMCS